MKRFVQIARGSANELEYHLLLARDLQLLLVEKFKELEAKTPEIQRMLAAPAQRIGATDFS
jgi:four helix bundle protein